MRLQALLLLALLAGATLGALPWKLLGSSSVSENVLDLDDANERALWTQPYYREDPNASSDLLSVPMLDRMYRYPAAQGGGLMTVYDAVTYTFMLDAATRNTYKLIQVSAYYHLVGSIDAVAFGPSPECPRLRVTSTSVPRSWSAEFLAGKNAATPGYGIYNLNTGVMLYSTRSDTIRINVMEVVPNPLDEPTLCALQSNGHLVCLDASVADPRPTDIDLTAVLPGGASPNSFTWSCRMTPSSLPLALVTDWGNSLLYFVEFDADLTTATLLRVETSVPQPIRPTAVPDETDRFVLKSDSEPHLIYSVAVVRESDTLLPTRTTVSGTATILFQNVVETAMTKKNEVLAAENPLRTVAPTAESKSSSAQVSDTTMRNVFLSLVVGGFVVFTVIVVAKLLVNAVRRSREASIRRHKIETGENPYPRGSQQSGYWELQHQHGQPKPAVAPREWPGPRDPITPPTDFGIGMNYKDNDDGSPRPRPQLYTQGLGSGDIALEIPLTPPKGSLTHHQTQFVQMQPIGASPHQLAPPRHSPPPPPPAHAPASERAAYSSMWGNGTPLPEYRTDGGRKSD